MLVILLGTLLMKKIMGIENGVSVGTQPLSILMEEKMNDKLVPTAVLSMQGQLKRISNNETEASLSSPEDEVLKGLFPVLLGHPESWASDKEKLQNHRLQSITSTIKLTNYMKSFITQLNEIFKDNIIQLYKPCYQTPVGLFRSKINIFVVLSLSPF